MKETLLAFSAIEAIVVGIGVAEGGYGLIAALLILYALVLSWRRPQISH